MSTKTALVTGADRGFGLFIASALADNGFRVYAGRVMSDFTHLDDLHARKPGVIPIHLDVSDTAEIENAKRLIENETGRLDLLVSNAAIMGHDSTSALGGEEPIDYERLAGDFVTNSMAGVALVDRLLPLLEKGDMKRLFFTSSEISSLKLMTRVGVMRYAMTKRALNLGVKMMFNDLRPRGYTFRLYQPGGMKRVMPNGEFIPNFGTVDPMVSAKEAISQMLCDRVDEDRLALIDFNGRELSF